MPKTGEMTYFEQIGEAGRRSSLRKPFSKGQRAEGTTCGDHLMAFGGLAMLLHPTPSRLLDLGCGTGWTSCFFARMGYDVVGQDISSQAIDLAREFAADEGLDDLTFIAGDYESLDEENCFDNAVFFDSLHHSVDERLALESVFRALRPGGICVTREPGVGHAAAQASIHATETYGVTERDMPPTRIAAHAFEIGFRQVNVYPFPNLLFRVQRGNRFSRIKRAQSPLKTWWDRVRGSFKAARGTARLHRHMYDNGGLVQLVK
jgi:SAM-dependent methyltransferase